MDVNGESPPGRDPGSADPGGDTRSRRDDLLREWTPRLAALPPQWRYRFLTARIDDVQGPVRLREDLPAQELEQSTFLANARLLLGKLKESPRKATEKGNLNRGLVRQMVAEMHMTEPYREWQPYIKVSKEADVWPLDVLRAVLQVAGLIRKYRGTFQITRKGLELLDEAAVGRLFAHLFRSYFGKFNLGYVDVAEDDPWMQATFAHSLWMIDMLTEDWVDVRTLRELILAEQDPERLVLEHQLEQAGGPSHWTPRSWRLYERRVLEPLVEFGLLESRVDPDVAGDRMREDSEPRQVRKTPLLDRFAQFELAPRTQVAVGGSSGEQIARLKIKLKGVRPPIWRRIEVPLSFTFRRLSDVIVAAFGWSNSHLHEFDIGRRGEPGERSLVMKEMLDEAGFRLFGPKPEDDGKVRLAKILKSGERLIYRYDFGDDWEFEVLVEAVFTAVEGVVYPRVTHGRRAAPPEDCGGVWGYEEILVLLDGAPQADRADETNETDYAEGAESADRVAWLRELYPYWKPEEFDLATANEWVVDAQPFWE
jgi:hypothetical protein